MLDEIIGIDRQTDNCKYDVIKGGTDVNKTDKPEIEISILILSQTDKKHETMSHRKRQNPVRRTLF